MKLVKFLRKTGGQQIGWTKELDDSLVDQLLAKGWVEVVGDKAPSKPKPKATPKPKAKPKAKKKITTVPKK